MTNFLILLFGVTMIYASSSTRVESYIKTLSFQGVLLFLIVLGNHTWTDYISLAFLAAETLVFKAIIIPVFMTRIVRKNGIFREVEPYIPYFYSLIFTSIMFAAGIFISFWVIDQMQSLRPVYFGVAASVIISGMFLIMTRKKLITHVMCYIMMENGIFLLTLSVIKEMPMIVNLGVLLDIFAAVFILGLFATKINEAFDEMDVKSLSELKD
jgi:hydrogenase-4 component E